MKVRISRSLMLVLASSVALLVSGMAVTGTAGARPATASASAKGKVAKRGPKGPRGRRGARGPAGAAGAAGAPGAQGPPGPAGPAGQATPLIYKAVAPSGNTTIFDGSKLRIEGACAAGPSTGLQARSLADNGILRATDVVSGTITATNNFDLNQTADATPGGAQNNYVLTYLAGDGQSIVTADYGVANATQLSAVDCALFGTVFSAAGA